MKIIERYVHYSLYDFVQLNNLIYSRQSGFRPAWFLDCSD